MFLKVCIDHLFDDLETEKEIIVLEKAWKKSWILDPNICVNPVIGFVSNSTYLLDSDLFGG